MEVESSVQVVNIKRAITCAGDFLLITHNKTLAGQLYAEFKEFFPENAVEYFVS